MPEPKTKRAFEQRLLDGFGRSGIRREALRLKGQALRRRYGALVLGATIAVGGLSVPAALSDGPRDVQAEKERDPAQPPVTGISEKQGGMLQSIAGDLKVAQSIAREVTGGVQAAASDVASTATGSAAREIAGEQEMRLVTEAARENFFKTEIPFGSLIYKEAKKNDISPELLAAIVKQESQFKPTARSHAGAQGLMQLVPRTGRWMGAKNLMNPTENVQAGAKYLKYLNERFDGNTKNVLAAYNAGEGNVRKFGGIPPFRETQSYVKKVLNNERDFRDQVTGHVAELTVPVMESAR